MAIWTNGDGLRIKIGGSEANVTQGGEYNHTGFHHEIEVRFNATSLGTGAALLEPGIIIPRGARIDEVEVVAETAVTSGGAATLNVGAVRLDNTTIVSATGFVAGLALASMSSSGEKTVLRPEATSAGTLIGTTLANPVKFVADYDTAAYTAGAILVRVRFYVPIPNATNVNL